MFPSIANLPYVVPVIIVFVIIVIVPHAYVTRANHSGIIMHWIRIIHNESSIEASPVTSLTAFRNIFLRKSGEQALGMPNSSFHAD